MPVTVAFVAETATGERRAALSPETCKKFLASQARVRSPSASSRSNAAGTGATNSCTHESRGWT